LVLVKGECQLGSQFSPTTHRLWFWLKGIARWDLRLAQPYKFWFWLKGIARWDLRLAQPHRGFYLWLKGNRNRRFQVKKKETEFRGAPRSSSQDNKVPGWKDIAVKIEFQINQVLRRSRLEVQFCLSLQNLLHKFFTP